MKYRINDLPHWVLTDEHVAFYDTESLTAIKMVARMYAKMQELVNDYNHFTQELDRELKDFECGIRCDFSEFKDNINKIVEEQNQNIEDAINYMKDNLIETCTNLFQEALDNGRITASLGEQYNASTESLVLSISAINNESESELNG